MNCCKDHGWAGYAMQCPFCVRTRIAKNNPSQLRPGEFLIPYSMPVGEGHTDPIDTSPITPDDAVFLRSMVRRKNSGYVLSPTEEAVERAFEWNRWHAG